MLILRTVVLLSVSACAPHSSERNIRWRAIRLLSWSFRSPRFTTIGANRLVNCMPYARQQILHTTLVLECASVVGDKTLHGKATVGVNRKNMSAHREDHSRDVAREAQELSGGNVGIS